MSEQEQTVGAPRYPDCTVELTDTSSNAVSIIMRVRRGLEKHLREQGIHADRIEAITTEFMDEARSGDYDNVLTTAFRWVNIA